jgi:hypothetical protein
MLNSILTLAQWFGGRHDRVSLDPVVIFPGRLIEGLADAACSICHDLGLGKRLTRFRCGPII